MKLEKRLEINGHAGAIYTCDFQEKHYIFTGAGDQFVAKWNLESGTQETFSVKCEQAVYQLKLIKNGLVLLIGLSNGAIHVVDLLKKKELKHFIQHHTAIFRLKENPHKGHFYSSDAEGNLGVWDLETYELLLFLPLAVGKIRNIELHDNGEQIILSCQDGYVRIFNTTSFNETRSFKAHDLGVNDTKQNPLNSSVLFSVGKDGMLKCWHIESMEQLVAIPAHNFGIYQLEFLNNGENFVTISRDKSIKLWDTATLKVLEKVERKHGGHSHAVNAIAKISEFTFVSVGDDKRILYWELRN